MRKSTTPKGVASLLALLPRVVCVALANPALSKVQPRCGKGTPCGWRGLSNVQWVMALRVVWWGLVGRLISFGVNCAWMEFCLYGIAWKNMMEIGRGGAYVPARVAQQGRIHRSFPRTMRVFLVWKCRYADVRAGTQARPYVFEVECAGGVNCAPRCRCPRRPSRV
ncbi:hypothetical protein SAMN02745202_02415 [Segatella oulorum]|uniref:Secreted protein n=1 Tax=Segatella oulorum TaxID=28136 RepID=A0A1T4RT80_9BACT|nr:hypothetical protein SAMN02745202_02415 [Segatella oulorum]